MKEPPASRSIVFQTRTGTSMRAEVRLEPPIERQRAAVEIHARACPSARLRSITSAYNCVGMVVATRRGWVEPDELLMILREDGYRKLPGEADAKEGDVVVYRLPNQGVSHVGIVVGKNIVADHNADALVILSKWGMDGEYVHNATALPALLGRPAEYWTDRKDLP